MAHTSHDDQHGIVPTINDEVAAIWEAVLGRQRIEHTADFFSLGGDSIQAVQIVTRLREQFPVELSLRTVFTYSTIADLATYIETAPRYQVPFENGEEGEV